MSNSTTVEHESSLSHASLLKLIGTGILFGVIHVLTGKSISFTRCTVVLIMFLGPDHLSALATLSVGSSWRSFGLGVRWGCGHSIGLIIIALIFVNLDGHVDLDKFSTYTDGIVGIFMIALGVYGIYSSYKKFRQPEIPFTNLKDADDLEIEIELPPTVSHRRPSLEEPIAEGSETELLETTDVVDESKPHPKCHMSMENPAAQKIMALTVGIVHGIAGPGGILGVLPAVGLHDTVKTCAYLGSFCLTSILIMGSFAAMYGEATGRLSANSKRLAFRLSLVSSMLSIIVGILWIVLLAMGKLDQVFG